MASALHQLLRKKRNIIKPPGSQVFNAAR